MYYRPKQLLLSQAQVRGRIAIFERSSQLDEQAFSKGGCLFLEL